MASDFYWKTHDTSPTIKVQLLDSAGAPVVVTGGSVKFVMMAQGGGAPKVNAAGTIVDGPTGVVSYTPVASDTDTTGTYQAEWEVVYLSGAKQTFPDPGYNTVTITADLNST